MLALLGDQRRVDLEDRGDRGDAIGGAVGRAVRGGQACGDVGEQGVALVDEVEAAARDLVGDLPGGRGDGLLALARVEAARQAVAASSGCRSARSALARLT